MNIRAGTTSSVCCVIARARVCVCVCVCVRARSPSTMRKRLLMPRRSTVGMASVTIPDTAGTEVGVRRGRRSSGCGGSYREREGKAEVVHLYRFSGT